MPLTIGIPRETFAGEKRVATVPEVVEKLIKLGFAVNVESDAGAAANFADDTYRAAGASIVAVGQSEADRLGLNYQSGRRVQLGTANGTAAGWLIRINTLRVGDVTAYDVEAVVMPAAMPAVLLGNSFLTRFNMRRDGDQMVLIRR